MIYYYWTYEELGTPMPGRAEGKPITVVSRQAITYDARTQQHLDIDEAVNGELCADLMARSGAYFIGADGKLKHDTEWREMA